jgi:hypothetical protein
MSHLRRKDHLVPREPLWDEVLQRHGRERYVQSVKRSRGGEDIPQVFVVPVARFIKREHETHGRHQSETFEQAPVRLEESAPFPAYLRITRGRLNVSATAARGGFRVSELDVTPGRAVTQDRRSNPKFQPVVELQ